MIALGNGWLVLSLLVGFGGIGDLKDLRDIHNRPIVDTMAPIPKGICLLFLGAQCPVSNTLAPEFARLHKEYGPKGIIIVGIYPEPDFTPADATTHAKEYSLGFSLALDPKQTLARQINITYVPEAAILNPKGKLLWHGRINDIYTPEGKKRFAPTSHDLRTALDALLLGKELPPAKGKGYGCPLPR